MKLNIQIIKRCVSLHHLPRRYPLWIKNMRNDERFDANSQDSLCLLATTNLWQQLLQRKPSQLHAQHLVKKLLAKWASVKQILIKRLDVAAGTVQWSGCWSGSDWRSSCLKDVEGNGTAGWLPTKMYTPAHGLLWCVSYLHTPWHWMFQGLGWTKAANWLAQSLKISLYRILHELMTSGNLDLPLPNLIVQVHCLDPPPPFQE